MKTTLRSIICMVLVLALCSVSLFAQGSQESSSEKEEKVTITFWDGNWDEESFAPVLALWNEKYPNIEVKGEFFSDNGMFDKYMLSMQTGTGPDVAACALDWTTTLGTAGLLEPLNSYLEKDGIDVSQYVQGAINASTIDGNLYAIPFRSETYALFYNIDILKEAGYDKAPETWDEVVEIAKACTKGDVAGYGLCGTNFGNFSFQYITMLRCHGGSVLTEDWSQSALDSDVAIQVAELYKELANYAPKSYKENANTDNRNLFATGKIAMYLSGIYDVPEIYKTNPDLNFACVMVPTANGAERSTILGGWSVAIPATSKHKEEAALFLEFLTSPEVAELYTATFTGTATPAKAFQSYSEDIVKPHADALAYATPLPAVGPISMIRQTIFNDLSLCLGTSMSAKDAMLQTSADVNKLLADN